MNEKYSQLYIYFVLVLVGLYLVILPALQYQANGIENVYDTKRLFQLLLFACLSILFCINKKLQEGVVQVFKSLHYLVQVGVLIFFIIGFISSLMAEFPAWGLLENAHYLMMFLVLLLIAFCYISYPKEISEILKGIVVLCVALYLLKFIIGYFLHLSLENYPLWPGYEHKVGLFGFSNIRFFNHTQTWTIPLLIVFCWQTKQGKFTQYFFYFCTVLWISLLFASSTRGAFLGIMIPLMFSLFIYRKKAVSLLKLTFIFFTSGLLLKFLLFDVITQSTIKTILRFDNSRGSTWVQIFNDVLVNPIFGYGPMHYASFNNSYYRGHPHNWFMQIAYEWGAIAAIMLLIIIIWGIYKYVQTTKNNEDHPLNSSDKFSMGIIWSISAALIHGLVSGIIVTSLSQVWFSLVTGIALGIYFKSSNKSLQVVYSYRLKVMLTIVFIWFSYSFWFYHHGDYHQEEHLEQYIEETGKTSIRPRFWQLGEIGFESVPSSSTNNTGSD